MERRNQNYSPIPMSRQMPAKILPITLSSQVRRYIYVGLTSNLEERLRRHNKGYEQTTKAYRPFKLIYTEECDTRIDARQREKYYKSGVGKEFLKSLE